MTIALQALSLVKKAGPVPRSLHITLEDQWSMWMQDGCKVYMGSYVALNVSCFKVTWILFKNRLLKVRLINTKWETMALWTLTTVDLFYFVVCEDMHEYKFTGIAFGWGVVTYDFTVHLRAHDHTTWFWRCFGTGFNLDTLFWTLTSSWPWLLARVWSGPWANLFMWSTISNLISANTSRSKSNPGSLCAQDWSPMTIAF